MRTYRKYDIIQNALLSFKAKTHEKGVTVTQALILASQSPRRKELISYLGVPFEVKVSDVPELAEGTPDGIVTENARRKARAVAGEAKGSLVIGSDTLVFAGGEPLGKPRDEEDALRMLRMLQGGWHEVYTGICVTDGEKEDVRYSVSRVHFIPLTDKELLRYIRTGEPMDKAGAYALQGRGGLFIDRMEGSYSSVIGMDICLLRAMLKARGREDIV